MNMSVGPGTYSAFVLLDNGTWKQPVFYLDKEVSESLVVHTLITEHGGFCAYGIFEDNDCPDEYIDKELFNKEKK